MDSGNWQAAIALYPTSIESLMSVADAGEVMPPKSTWFEPKLKAGSLFTCWIDYGWRPAERGMPSRVLRIRLGSTGVPNAAC